MSKQTARPVSRQGRRNAPDRTPRGSEAFSERVMTVVRRETSPTPTRSFMAALGRRSPRDAASVLLVAWHLGTVRRWKVAPGVRARSIALVLGVAGAMATVSFATAAAVRVTAEPVIQLFQTGADERGQVEDHPSGTDDHGPVGGESQGTGGPEAGDRTDDMQPRTAEPSTGDEDMDEAGSDDSTDADGGNAADSAADPDNAGGEGADSVTDGDDPDAAESGTGERSDAADDGSTDGGDATGTPDPDGGPDATDEPGDHSGGSDGADDGDAESSR